MSRKIIFILVGLCMCLIKSYSLEVYISADGNDSNSGSEQSPLKTLGAALEKVNGQGGGSTIWIKGGVYHVTKTVILNSQHSGSQDNPLTIKAVDGEEVIFYGGDAMDSKSFFYLKNENYLKRLPENARGNVMIAPVSKEQEKYFYNKDDYNKTSELSWDGHTMRIAQFPNQGYGYISSVVDAGPTVGNPLPYSEENPSGGIFKIRESIDWQMAETEFERTHDMLIEGYFHADWQFTRERVGNIKSSDKTIQLLRYTTYGVGHPSSIPRRVRIYNALCQLDQPGEWYFDRIDKFLYLWPIDEPTEEKPILLLGDQLDWFIKGSADYVSIENITFENFNQGIFFDNSDHILIAGCKFRNFSQLAIRITGTHNGVKSCDFGHVMGSVVMRGYTANRRTLTPEHNYIINCDFHHSKFRGYGNVVISGVGFYFAHNLLHDMNAGMVVYGNNNILEYNEYYNMGYEMGDWNAIYTNQDISARGNQFRYNFFHHFFATPNAHQVFAVRTDDWGTGFNVVSNIFYKSGHGPAQWTGPENSIKNNVVMESPYLWWTTQDPYALTDKSDWATKTEVLQLKWDAYLQLKQDIIDGKVSFNDKRNKIGQAESVFGVGGWDTNTIWKAHYPKLDSTFIFDDPDRNPWMSVYNDVTNNYMSGGKSLPFHLHGYNLISNFSDVRLITPKTTKIEMPNTFSDGNTIFENVDSMDYRFRTDFSPVAGFEKWNFDSVGLVKDKYRTNLPDKKLYRNQIKSKYEGINSTGGIFDYDALNLRYEVPEYVQLHYDLLINNYTNLALNKPSYQSSTYQDYNAAAANDGITDPDLANGSVTHTLQDENAWWEVDLGDIFDISLIRLWNRNLYEDRFSKVHVLISEEPFASFELESSLNQPGVKSIFIEGFVQSPSLLQLENTKGRYVRVQLSKLNYLTICEVEVYGKEKISPSKIVPLQNAKTKLEVYPNPLKDRVLNIKISGKDTHQKLSIMNILGKTIFESSINNDELKEIPYSSFPAPGIYFLKISNETRQEVRKILIE